MPLNLKTNSDVMPRNHAATFQDFHSAWTSLPVLARGVIRFFGWLERAAPGYQPELLTLQSAGKRDI